MAIAYFRVAAPREESLRWIAVFEEHEEIDAELHEVVWAGHADSAETAITAAAEEVAA